MTGSILGAISVTVGKVMPALSRRGDRRALRTIADDQLDDEVDAMTARLGRFDHDAIARTEEVARSVEALLRQLDFAEDRAERVRASRNDSYTPSE